MKSLFTFLSTFFLSTLLIANSPIDVPISYDTLPNEL